MKAQEVKLMDKWMTLQNADMVKSDIFEIIDEDDTMICDEHMKKAHIEDLPPAFFDFFMVIKSS